MNETNMKKVLIFIALTLCSCVKWVDPEVNGKCIAERIVPAEASKATVYVGMEPDAIWTVETAEPWLKVNFSGYVKGEYAVTLTCASNESTPGRRNFARIGCVYVKTYDHRQCDTIVVKQHGIEPQISLEDVSVSASQTMCDVPMITNLTDEQRPNITFSADKAWVRSMAVAPSNTHLSVELSGDAAGEATLTMCYTPQWGEPVKESCTISVIR